MIIQTGSQQPVIAQQTINSRTDGTASSAARQKSAATTAQKRDTVDFSTSFAAELQKRQEGQDARVETIKSQVNSGEYKVSSQAVAEKMLSGYFSF